MTITKSIQSARSMTQKFLCLQHVISEIENCYKSTQSFLLKNIASHTLIKDFLDTLNTDNFNYRFKIPINSIPDNVQTIGLLTHKLLYTQLVQKLFNCNYEMTNSTGLNITDTIKKPNASIFAAQSADRKNYDNNKFNNEFITDSAQNFNHLSENVLNKRLNYILYNNRSKTINNSTASTTQTAKGLSKKISNIKMFMSSIEKTILKNMDIWRNINKIYNKKGNTNTLVLKSPQIETKDNKLLVSLKKSNFNLLNKKINKPHLYLNNAEAKAVKSELDHTDIIMNKNIINRLFRNSNTNYVNSNMKNSYFNTMLNKNDKTNLLTQNDAVINITRHQNYQIIHEGYNNNIQSNCIIDKKIFNTLNNFSDNKNITKFNIVKNTSAGAPENINNVCYDSVFSVNKLFNNIPQKLYIPLINKNIAYINIGTGLNNLNIFSNKTKKPYIYVLNIYKKIFSLLTKTVMLSKLAEPKMFSNYNTKSPLNISGVNYINNIYRLSDKDLTSLRETTNYVKKNVYAQPVINVTTGDINEKADIDFLIKKIGQSVQEGMETSIEGVVNYV